MENVCRYREIIFIFYRTSGDEETIFLIVRKLQKIALFLTFFDQKRSNTPILSDFAGKYGTNMGDIRAPI